MKGWCIIGIQCTIVCSNGQSDPVVFIATDVAHTTLPGQYCLDIIPTEPDYDIKRFHVPGPNQNIIIRCGTTDGHITVKVRIVNTKQVIKNIATTYKLLWSQNAVDITDEGGTVYSNCNIVPGGFTQDKKTTPMGYYDGQGNVICFFECSFMFRFDGSPPVLA